ncbi:5' nucleotidase, NT5C type [Paenibacillus xylaniclasticus]|uniref:5' nucleotidase, NT5C type n=1 Tax=Paenibacillus xylaniclasticus TaxID=588083 RepID=UPI00176F3B4B|nr:MULTISPECIES: 5'-3'-deoxyribonucleotidase [Paenibacillus]GFN34111.1 putative 5'(3')-deoxyribonucleotidase [Paenibacillus curdlanolyticus]
MALFNEHFNEAMTAQDTNGTRLWKLYPERAEQIIGFVNEPRFFRDLAVIEGSQQVIRELSEHYEIFFTTAAMEHPSSFTCKYEWLREHFSWISPMNDAFCGDKSIIRADCLIDDSPRHFERFQGHGILFTAPHNIYETGYIRVNNWHEVRDYFLK